MPDEVQQDKMGGSSPTGPSPCSGHVLVQDALPAPCTVPCWREVVSYESGQSWAVPPRLRWQPPSLTLGSEVISAACAGKCWVIFQHLPLTHGTEDSCCHVVPNGI